MRSKLGRGCNNAHVYRSYYCSVDRSVCNYGVRNSEVLLYIHLELGEYLHVFTPLHAYTKNANECKKFVLHKGGT